MKKIITLLAGIALSQLATAQVIVTGSSLSYSQNFDLLDTSSSAYSTNPLPAGWSIFKHGTSSAATTYSTTYKGGNGSTNTGDVYSFGSYGSTERALGSISSGSDTASYGVYFLNNTGATINGFTVKYRVEQWRFGGFSSSRTSTPDTTRFLYSTNANGLSDTGSAFTWTEDVNGMLNTPNITDTTTGAKNGNATGYFTNKSFTETVSIPAGGHVILKWLDVNIFGNDDGLAIDSFSITFTTSTPPSLKPVITSLFPANGATNVPTNIGPTMTFNKIITKGTTGNIYITNETDHSTVTKSVTSSDVSVSGAIVGITNVTFLPGKTYHITFDSVAFDSSVYNSFGIYDTTQWRFSTISGVVTLDSLNENFNTACASNALPAGWLKYSVSGPGQVWNCTAYGYGGTEGMQMNGYASGANNVNEDWLITPQLFLNFYPGSVSLQFVAKKEFAGADLHVLASSNYTGAGDPNAATWTDLNVNFTPASVDTQFHNYTTSLTAFKSQHIFVGVKYTSTATDGARWTVDNMQTLATTGVAAVSNENIQLAVLGVSTTNTINLIYTANEEGNNELIVYDITGRIVHSENIHVVAGTQRIAVTGLNLHSGMYMVKLCSNNSFGIAKTVVQ